MTSDSTVVATEQPRRVLIDCDPGIDDALALIYLAGLHSQGDVELLGVTTTAGNTSTAQTAINAAWVLEQCGFGDEHIPVAAGEEVPLEVDLVTTPETHGDTGLGYVTATGVSPAGDWRELWSEALSGGAVDLIVTGPCTNLAIWLREGHELADFASVTVMGGAVLYPGNTTPTAEWNFWVDPHAADEVFRAATPGHRVTLCPLNVTEQMLIGPGEAEQLIDALGDVPIAAALPDILRFYWEFHRSVGVGYTAQIHDLLTCMIALNQVKYSAYPASLRVEAGSELTRGTSLAFRGAQLAGEPTVRVLERADIASARKRFYETAAFLD